MSYLEMILMVVIGLVVVGYIVHNRGSKNQSSADILRNKMKADRVENELSGMMDLKKEQLEVKRHQARSKASLKKLKEVKSEVEVLIEENLAAEDEIDSLFAELGIA